MVATKATWVEVSGICGILAPIVAFACILSAIAFYPQFSWTNDALSDLGIVSGATAILFNSGLMISGFLISLFGIGLPVLLGNKLLGKMSGLLFIIGGVAMFAIGVFPESAEPMHYYASVAFFVLLPTSLLLISATFLLAARRKIGSFTFLVAVTAAVVWVAQFSVRFVRGPAIPETISGLSGSVWSVVLGFNMLKRLQLQKSSINKHQFCERSALRITSKLHWRVPSDDIDRNVLRQQT
jgi:hypothetical membrane protein